jgi:glycosyltransferase involved in cell wall biosynthesis
MRCPRLHELPPSPSEKSGWPWTEESTLLQHLTPAGREWSRITIITPSFNQGAFIEETIRSVLLQGYPNLEYIVMDGGSTDNSVEIIKKYSPWLSYWVSEPDGGQSDAINRGLIMGSGTFATWINSDDMLCRNALADHATRVGFAKNTVYVGICEYIDVESKILRSHQSRIQCLDDLLRIGTVWRAQGHIVQPEVLLPRDLVLAVGGLNANNHSTMDYELWGKLFLAGALFYYTDIHFGMFREHDNQKTHDMLRQTRSLLESASKLVHEADCFSEEIKKGILSDLRAYGDMYENDYWKATGRLARLGLPRRMVSGIRRLKDMMQTSPFQSAGSQRKDSNEVTPPTEHR